MDGGATSSEAPSDPTTSAAERVRRVAVELAALAQDGATFAQDRYDQVRYAQASRLAAELFAVLTARPADDLHAELGRDSGYATPKVDVRGVLFDDDERVLLMQERSDGRWCPPGGWADPLDTPRTAVLREVREESGYAAEVVKLFACWERDVQGHVPPLPVAVFKLFFLCRATGDVRPAQELETLDVGWFSLDALPPLSAARVTERQLRRALEHHRDPSLPVDLD
ncbi:NUDIX hydrolase N-terminal domain-containing protein [Quadrisphaera setariae]|uniref:NUDIX hydrolase N-terminal domain-containing protein n=1 Tax=Quadrisphaera setariae TaxID=2593304 RepID=UPI002103288E|nr:NUDIX hydrolase N-terminal domain-containing protein [Quadrisphaera setariae]